MINYWGLKPVIRAHNPRPRFCCGSLMHKPLGPCEGPRTHQCTKTSRHKPIVSTEKKRDEYPTARPTSKRRSNRNITAESRQARPKAEHRAPQNPTENPQVGTPPSPRPDPLAGNQRGQQSCQPRLGQPPNMQSAENIQAASGVSLTNDYFSKLIRKIIPANILAHLSRRLIG